MITVATTLPESEASRATGYAPRVGMLFGTLHYLPRHNLWDWKTDFANTIIQAKERDEL
jgi:hypothetical protein